jgi:pimeloyl-ACP methyl ester carboxylesterase
MSAESVAMFARLSRDLATGDKEAAARNFVDALGGTGAWERRPAAQKQVFLDNIATGPACAERPAFMPEEIAAIVKPMLLLKGERSPPRYAAMMAAMHALNAQARPPVTIPDAAHSMHRDNPEAFNAAVLAFLAALA